MTICGKDIPGKANTHAKALRAYSVFEEQQESQCGYCQVKKENTGR